MKTIEELKEYLKPIAEMKTWVDEDDEDFDIYSYCGGNFDDAFIGGENVGRVELARTILEILEREE